MSSKDKSETLALLRQHVQETLTDYVGFCEKTYVQVTDGFINEDLRSLRKAMNATDDQKKMLKKRRRKEILGLRRLPITVAMERILGSTWEVTVVSRCFIA